MFAVEDTYSQLVTSAALVVGRFTVLRVAQLYGAGLTRTEKLILIFCSFASWGMWMDANKQLWLNILCVCARGVKDEQRTSSAGHPGDRLRTITVIFNDLNWGRRNWVQVPALVNDLSNHFTAISVVWVSTYLVFGKLSTLYQHSSQSYKMIWANKWSMEHQMK